MNPRGQSNEKTDEHTQESPMRHPVQPRQENPQLRRRPRRRAASSKDQRKLGRRISFNCVDRIVINS